MCDSRPWSFEAAAEAAVVASLARSFSSSLAMFCCLAFLSLSPSPLSPSSSSASFRFLLLLHFETEDEEQEEEDSILETAGTALST
jgi:hypothetical protein